MLTPIPRLPVALVVLAFGGAVHAQPEMDIIFEHDGDPVYSVLPPGRIPAIDDPQFVRGEAAHAQMSPDEPVFGLIVGDEIRAYSLWQLDAHEIVNDTVGGTAIAATW